MITTKQVRDLAEKVATKTHAFAQPIVTEGPSNFAERLAVATGSTWPQASAAVEQAVTDGALEYDTNGVSRVLRLAPYWVA